MSEMFLRRLSRSQKKLNRTFSQETIAEEDDDEQGGFNADSGEPGSVVGVLGCIVCFNVGIDRF